MSKAVPLRVVLVFAGDNLEERHFDASETITVGSSLQATFLVPDRGRGEAFALLRPGPDGLYRVSLDRQMTGKLYVGESKEEGVVVMLYQMDADTVL